MRLLIEKSQNSLITCDNTKCNYTIPYSQEEEHNTYKYINKPCPLCGENLLTEQDYLQHQKVVKLVNWLNRWFSWTTYFYSKKSWDKNRKEISVHVHDGVKIKKEEGNN